jgi:dienelactone hydrolase
MSFIMHAVGAIAILVCGTVASAQMQRPDPEKLGVEVANDLVVRHFSKVEAQFDDKMHSALPVGRLSAVWDSLIEKAGPFERVLGTHLEEQAGMSVVQVTCKFKDDTFDLQLTFDPQDRIAGMRILPGSIAPDGKQGWLAPDYAKPDTFHEVDVTVQAGDWKMPGTLTLPNGKGPFPAVVLVHGSGPEDQDETIGGNKPFKDLAWGLASRSVAVLRYVKRTKQYGAQSLQPGVPFTVKQETTEDAEAAVALLAARPEIDHRRIFVLGHSLGGMLAPRIALADKQVAGIIIAAGTAQPLANVIVQQLKYLASLPGGNSDEMKKQVEAAERAKAEIEGPSLKPDSTVSVLGIQIPGSYFLDLRDYHPAEVAAQLQIPILVLQGGRDYQVTSQDYDLWKAALARDPRATFKFYPGLTHLFMTGKGSGQASPSDYSVVGHVSDEVVQDIAQWVQSNQAAK